jgi:hypothetical protein
MNEKGCGRKRSWLNLRHYCGICLEGLRISTSNLSQDSLSPGQDMNPGPPEHKAGVQRSSVLVNHHCEFDYHINKSTLKL